MLRYLAIVECALINEGKYLIIRRPDGVHAGGLLAFPGGKVEEEDGKDDHDILIATAKREVQEEVGLDLLDPVRFATSSYFLDTYGQHVLDIIFYCRLEKTKIKVVPSEKEVPEYFWLSSEEIDSHPLAPEWLKRYVGVIDQLTN